MASINRILSTIIKIRLEKLVENNISEVQAGKSCLDHIFTIRQIIEKMLANKLSEVFCIIKGLRQGCGMSPTLFKIHLQDVLRKWKRTCCKIGIKINDKTIYNLLFADDQVIIGQDQDDIEYMTRKLKGVRNKKAHEAELGEGV